MNAIMDHPFATLSRDKDQSFIPQMPAGHLGIHYDGVGELPDRQA